MSNNNDSLSLNEYLELIKPYLYDLINVHKAEISFISQKPNSNEIRVMFTRSIPEELVVKQKKSLKDLLCQYYKNIKIIYRTK